MKISQFCLCVLLFISNYYIGACYAQPYRPAPDLTYATYLGGSDTDWGLGITADNKGNAYITGYTYSSDFPTTAGAYDTSYSGILFDADIFVSKLSADGSKLVYSTYIGVEDDDIGEEIAVDEDGFAYVTGETWSAGFPVTPGSFDTTFHRAPDNFVCKLNKDGSGLVYSTFLGGSDYESSFSIALDRDKNSYIAGLTGSADFPVTAGAYDTIHNGAVDAFVSKLDADGSKLLYSTYLGGSDGDIAYCMAVENGIAYVSGITYSGDFPTTPGAFDTSFNGSGHHDDIFISKLSADGASLLFSTYLGGTGGEEPKCITVDFEGNVYIAGYTSSGDYPTTPGAFDTVFDGYYDAFVSKLNNDGTRLIFSTYLGGSEFDGAYGVAVDSLYNVYVSGTTGSSEFPVTDHAYSASLKGDSDIFIVKMSADGTSLEYSTFFGGSDSDGVEGFAMSLPGFIYLTGSTYSRDFPVTPGAYDTIKPPPYNGESFVVKFNLSTPEVTALSWQILIVPFSIILIIFKVFTRH